MVYENNAGWLLVFLDRECCDDVFLMVVWQGVHGFDDMPQLPWRGRCAEVIENVSFVAGSSKVVFHD